jgi:hypothetical protein
MTPGARSWPDTSRCQTPGRVQMEPFGSEITLQEAGSVPFGHV